MNLIGKEEGERGLGGGRSRRLQGEGVTEIPVV